MSLDRQVKQKSYETAIEAARLLKERGHSFRRYVFGEGELALARFDANYPDANMIPEMKLLGYNVLQIPADMYTGIWKPAKYMVRSTIALIVARMKGWSYNYDRKRQLHSGRN